MRKSPLPIPVIHQHFNYSLFSFRDQFSPPGFLSDSCEQPWDTQQVAGAEPPSPGRRPRGPGSCGPAVSGDFRTTLGGSEGPAGALPAAAVPAVSPLYT